jgi:hypothetical protein
LEEHWWLMLSSPNTCLIISRASISLFPRFAQNFMLFLCQIHPEITTGQKHNSKQKDVKNQYIRPAAQNFVHWLPRYASTIIYCCITLLQLLYRWQHQYRKLWTDKLWNDYNDYDSWSHIIMTRMSSLSTKASIALPVSTAFITGIRIHTDSAWWRLEWPVTGDQ